MAGQALANLYQVGALASGVRNALPYDSTTGAFRASRMTVADFGKGSPRRLGPQAMSPAKMQPVKEPKSKARMQRPQLRSSLGRRRY